MSEADRFWSRAVKHLRQNPTGIYFVGVGLLLMKGGMDPEEWLAMRTPDLNGCVTPDNTGVKVWVKGMKPELDEIVAGYAREDDSKE